MGETPASDTVEAEFARRLAGNEKKGRDRALKKLKQFLNLRSARTDGGFTRVEMLSIWKGLFYCMWMSDKPLVQEDLANRISDLMLGLQNTKTVMLFFDVFLETMHREWRGIDRLRMDKFYLLVRCMLEKGFKFLQSQEWDDGVVDWMLAILKNGPICPTNPVMGMHYHMCDIYLEELAKVGKDSLSKETVLKLLDPYCLLITKARNVDLVRSATDEVFQQLVENSKPALDLLAKEEGLVDIRSHTKMEDLNASPITHLNVDYEALAERLFQLASQAGVLARNRKKAFRLVEKFRELGEGRLPLVDVPDAEYSSEDEVQELEENLMNEIVLESTKELQKKQKDKKERRKRKKKFESIEEEAENHDEKNLDTDDHLTMGNGGTSKNNGEEKEEETAEIIPRKKKKKKAVEDSSDLEPTVTKLRKKEKKKVANLADSGTLEHITAESNRNGLDTVDLNGSIQEQAEATEVKEDEYARESGITEEQSGSRAKRKKKKKTKAKSSSIILGSAVEFAEEEQRKDCCDPEVDCTSEHKIKTKTSRKKFPKISRRENMPDILQDVANREKHDEEDVDLMVNTSESFAILKQWLDTGSKPGKRANKDSDDTITADESATASSLPSKHKKNKKKRKSTPAKMSGSIDASDDSHWGHVENGEVQTKEPKEIEFQKFATICKAKTPNATSTFVKFSAAKVSRSIENRHLAAVKKRSEQPVRVHSPKKVVFEMSKTQIQPFRKNDKAIAVSPSPSNIAFDPKKTPDFGLLKRTKTPHRKRKSASDFF